MTNCRKKLTRDERYATVILQLKRGDGRDVIDREWAKGRTPAEIIMAFETGIEWDHSTPKAVGGTEHPANMQALVKTEHKIKTKRDRKEIDKGKRIIRAQEKHENNMAAKSSEILYEPPRKFKRPMPGSRASGIRKHVNGRVTRR